MSQADFSIRGDTTLDSSGFSGALNKIGSLSTKVFTGMVTMASAAITTVGSVGMAYNAAMESYQTNLTTMLEGNTDAAKKLTSEIENMAASTPLAMEDLMSAAQTLMSFGAADASNMTDTLRTIGDVAMGDANKLQSLSLAFGQMYSTGKLQGQDLLQMINAGFNPLMELSKMGYGTVAELKEQMSQGAISVEMVTAAFEHATKEGGQFYNAMENQSKTFDGQMSTMKDNANALAGALAEGLSEAATTTLLPSVNGWIDTLLTATKENGIAGAMAASGEVIAGMISMIFSMLPDLISTGLDLVDALMLGLKTALPLLMTSSTDIIAQLITGLIAFTPELLEMGAYILSQLVFGLLNNLPVLLQATIDTVSAFLDTIHENLPLVIDSGSGMLMSLIDGILAELPSLIQSAFDLVLALINTILENLPQIIQTGIKLVVHLVKGILQQLPEVIRSALEFCNTIKDTVEDFDWLKLGKDIIQGLIDGIGSMAGALWNAAKKVAKNAYDAIKDFFDIRSPSRKMRKMVGPHISSGLALGIEDDADKVEKAMRAMAQKGFDAVMNVPNYLGSMLNIPSTAFSNDNAQVGAVTNNVQNITFEQPMQAPDEIARALRIQQTYGLAGAY